MSNGYAGAGGGSDSRAHARDDLERHPGGLQCQRLLPAPAENVRVAPLRGARPQAARARATSSALMASWSPRSSGCLPTSTFSAVGGASDSKAGSVKRSWTTTSAQASSSAPRRVSSPGSTGTGSDQVDGAGQRRFPGSGRRFGRVNAGRPGQRWRPGSTLRRPGPPEGRAPVVEDHLGHLGSEPGAVAHRLRWPSGGPGHSHRGWPVGPRAVAGHPASLMA